MTEFLVQVALIFLLGMAGQLLGARTKLPSILFLLGFGFLAGPILGWIQPDLIPDYLLSPIIGLGVAVILFEGGLGLDFAQIKGIGNVVFRLVTVGVVITWGILAFAAYTFLGLDLPMALLLGAILVLSGPTVVLPLLRQLRPNRSVEATLRWEGIIIDPIGAVLAAIVFETILHGLSSGTGLDIGFSLLKIVGFGAAVAVIGAVIFVMSEKQYIIPDYLRDEFGLGLVLGSYVLAEVLQPEAGVFAVTLMGIVLANQRKVSVRHLLDFKETLSLVLIGTLFILLSSRLDLATLKLINPGYALFLVAAVFIARPLSVYFSTIGSKLSWRERVLIMAVAPRGIVAAAVTAFFALRLEASGVAGGDTLVAYVFITIVATAFIYGLGARPIGKLLNVVQSKPQGVLILGSNPMSRALAKQVKSFGFRVLIAETNPEGKSAARLADIEVVSTTLTTTKATEELDLDGIGHFWAFSYSEQGNSLSAVRLGEDLGRANVFQISVEEQDLSEPHLRGRNLFGSEITYQKFRDHLQGDKWLVRKTKITETFDRAAYEAQHGTDYVPLFYVHEAQDGKLELVTLSKEHIGLFRPGRTLVSLVRQVEQPLDSPIAQAEGSEPRPAAA